jgi:hypothetical protein
MEDCRKLERLHSHSCYNTCNAILGRPKIDKKWAVITAHSLRYFHTPFGYSHTPYSPASYIDSFTSVFRLNEEF